MSHYLYNAICNVLLYLRYVVTYATGCTNFMGFCSIKGFSNDHDEHTKFLVGKIASRKLGLINLKKGSLRIIILLCAIKKLMHSALVHPVYIHCI